MSNRPPVKKRSYKEGSPEEEAGESATYEHREEHAKLKKKLGKKYADKMKERDLQTGPRTEL